MKHERKLFRWMREWLKANRYNWTNWHYVKNTEHEVVFVNVISGNTMTVRKEAMMRDEHKRRIKRSSAAGSNL